MIAIVMTTTTTQSTTEAVAKTLTTKTTQDLYESAFEDFVEEVTFPLKPQPSSKHSFCDSPSIPCAKSNSVAAPDPRSVVRSRVLT